MPRVPDASSVTRLRAVSSSVVADPTKRSASYSPAQPALLYSLRASDAGRGMFPGQTTLSSPITCGYVNPRHRGFLTGPPLTESSPTFPVVMIWTAAGVDFSEVTTVDYEFELNLPPGPDFDAIFDPSLAPPINVQDIIRVDISTTDDSDLFGNITISTIPEWPAAVQSYDQFGTVSRLGAENPTFPGVSTIIQFRNVPVVANIRIRFYGISY
jgi:hypothetical protein